MSSNRELFLEGLSPPVSDLQQSKTNNAFVCFMLLFVDRGRAFTETATSEANDQRSAKTFMFLVTTSWGLK